MEWNGVMPAITTKFTIDDKLDLDLFNKNLEFQLKSDVQAIVLAGSLGEASTLSRDEINILTKNTVEFVNDKIPVVVNIFRNLNLKNNISHIYKGVFTSK